MRLRAAAFIALLVTSAAFAQTLTSVTPQRQRVYDIITLRGSGFGASQGSSDVLFTDGTVTLNAGKAFLWRDNFIQVRVPPGNRIGGMTQRIPTGPLQVRVRVGASESGPLPFQVITLSAGVLAFRELTTIDGDRDISPVLGIPNLNLGRSKDADVADVNGDGAPDILDNNSNNAGNSSHSVLHVNNRDKSFTAIPFEPLTAGESGTFAATIPSGGNFFADGVSYDADLVDLNNDELPDLIHTASTDTADIVRIFMNNRGGVPGRFEEQTSTRLPGFTSPPGLPDDIDAADLNADGFLDFGVTYRTATSVGGTSTTLVFINDGTGAFPNSGRIEIAAPSGISTHDIFFIDANNDRFEDIILCHEYPFMPARTKLYLHNGNNASPAFTDAMTFGASSATGEAADLNADGFLDFVTGQSDARVYLNSPASPGMFTEAELPNSGPGAFFYDIEFGDLNLDGAVDIVGVRITRDAEGTVAVWINDGNGNFTTATLPGASALLPGIGPYERLSADLLDYDDDGDLDLYVAGADGQSVTGNFGDVPNQFYENLVASLDLLDPRETRTQHAGSTTAGRPVLVRLAVNVPLATLGTSSFTVSIDGADLPASEIAAASPVGGEFWLIVRTPPKPNGCYDLAVRLVSDPLVRDLERRSLCYDTDRAFDRALAVDRTGSMLFDSVTGVSSDEKMVAARDAARLFIDLAADVDSIGVTSFKRDFDDGDGVVEQFELAQIDFTLRPAVQTAVDQRPAARTTIGALQPDGMPFSYETAIGAGLLEAFNMLLAGDPTHEREIVLISDGRENYPPYWRLPGTPGPVASAITSASPSVRVHTVAIGRDAGNEVLEDIARSTGGRFHNLIEGTGSFGLRSRLANIYKIIDEDIRDEQRFFYAEDVPEDLGTIPVEPGLESMTVAFHWDQFSIVSVTLLRPDGTIVVHAPPLVNMYDDATHRVYQIANPAPGAWRYRVGVQKRPSEFFAAASGISSIVMHADRAAPRPDGGAFVVPLYALLADFRPIGGATVNARVRLPDGSYATAVLFDDGSHGDGPANDGLYAVAFNTAQPGAHSVQIAGRGRSNRDIDFERTALFSFVIPGRVPENPDRDQPGGGSNDTADGPGFTGRRGERELGVFTGGNWPVGSTARVLDPGFLFGIDFLVRLNAQLRVGLQAAYHQFDEAGPGTGNVGISNASVIAVWQQPWGPYRVFVAGGPGWYRWSGSAHAGLQAGGGVELPVAGNVYLMTGATAHFVSGGNPENPRWWDAYLGFRFRLP